MPAPTPLQFRIPQSAFRNFSFTLTSRVDFGMKKCFAQTGVVRTQGVLACVGAIHESPPRILKIL
jgi:hypothetical protein